MILPLQPGCMNFYTNSTTIATADVMQKFLQLHCSLPTLGLAAEWQSFVTLNDRFMMFELGWLGMLNVYM